MSSTLPSIVTAALNDLRTTNRKCERCHKSNSEVVLLLCSRCKVKFYCTAACQRAHWPDHKGDCNRVRDDNRNINNNAGLQLSHLEAYWIKQEAWFHLFAFEMMDLRSEPRYCMTKVIVVSLRPQPEEARNQSKLTVEFAKVVSLFKVPEIVPSYKEKECYELQAMLIAANSHLAISGTRGCYAVILAVLDQRPHLIVTEPITFDVERMVSPAPSIPWDPASTPPWDEFLLYMLSQNE